ncbi:MAG: alanine racemase [Peptococcaceae bacterium]|jgi:alanine racemase|nr:alanine racemase [Peptococcaceae bacterium]MDH7526178.1 alanine racemase [Peptococcaceae bacterium]
MNIDKLTRPSWVEVDLDVITKNVKNIKDICGNKVTVIGTLKGHGYGHGLVTIANHLSDLGIDYYAVGHVHDGIYLRKHGVKGKIMVFGNTLPDAAELYTKYSLMPTFFNANDPEKYMSVLGAKTPLKVWIKVETGLGRLGVSVEEVPAMLKFIKEKTPYEIEGIYSHIGARGGSPAPEDKEYCLKSWELFRGLLEEIEGMGIQIPLKEINSSHSMITMPFANLNCVNVGGALYSELLPENKYDFGSAYKALKSKLISVKKFKAGSQIGGFPLERDSLIGVAPIGVMDGLSPKNKDHCVLVRGTRVPIRGPLTAECIRIDVTDAEGVSVGDEVTIVGRQGNEEITAKEMCDRVGITILQLWTGISPLTVPRVFYKNGKICGMEMIE